MSSGDRSFVLFAASVVSSVAAEGLWICAWIAVAIVFWLLTYREDKAEGR